MTAQEAANNALAFIVPNLAITVPVKLGAYSIETMSSLGMAFLIGGFGMAGRHLASWAIKKYFKKK